MPLSQFFERDQRQAQVDLAPSLATSELEGILPPYPEPLAKVEVTLLSVSCASVLEVH